MGQSSQIALFLGAERRGEMSRELSSAFQMLLDALGSSIWGLVSEIGGRFVHDAYASLCVFGDRYVNSFYNTWDMGTSPKEDNRCLHLMTQTAVVWIS